MQITKQIKKASLSTQITQKPSLVREGLLCSLRLDRGAEDVDPYRFAINHNYARRAVVARAIFRLRDPSRRIPRSFSPPIVSSSSEAKDLDGKGIIIPGCLLVDDTVGCGLLLPFVFGSPGTSTPTGLLPPFFRRRDPSRRIPRSFSPPIVSSSSEAKDLNGKGIIIPGCLLEDDTAGCGLLYRLFSRADNGIRLYGLRKLPSYR